MMHVFKKSRYPIKYSVDGDLYHLTLDFNYRYTEKNGGLGREERAGLVFLLWIS